MSDKKHTDTKIDTLAREEAREIIRKFGSKAAKSLRGNNGKDRAGALLTRISKFISNTMTVASKESVLEKEKTNAVAKMAMRQLLQTKRSADNPSLNGGGGGRRGTRSNPRSKFQDDDDVFGGEAGLASILGITDVLDDVLNKKTVMRNNTSIPSAKIDAAIMTVFRDFLTYETNMKISARIIQERESNIRKLNAKMTPKRDTVVVGFFTYQNRLGGGLEKREFVQPADSNKKLDRRLLNTFIKLLQAMTLSSSDMKLFEVQWRLYLKELQTLKTSQSSVLRLARKNTLEYLQRWRWVNVRDSINAAGSKLEMVDVHNVDPRDPHRYSTFHHATHDHKHEAECRGYYANNDGVNVDCRLMSVLMRHFRDPENTALQNSVVKYMQDGGVVDRAEELAFDAAIHQQTKGLEFLQSNPQVMDVLQKRAREQGGILGAQDIEHLIELSGRNLDAMVYIVDSIECKLSPHGDKLMCGLVSDKRIVAKLDAKSGGIANSKTVVRETDTLEFHRSLMGLEVEQLNGMTDEIITQIEGLADTQERKMTELDKKSDELSDEAEGASKKPMNEHEMAKLRREIRLLEEDLRRISNHIGFRRMKLKTVLKAKLAITKKEKEKAEDAAIAAVDGSRST